MCGRFALERSLDDLRDDCGLDATPDFALRDNNRPLDADAGGPPALASSLVMNEKGREEPATRRTPWWR